MTQRLLGMGYVCVKVLKAAITSPMSVEGNSYIHVCPDNLSVVQAAGSIPNGSSPGTFFFKKKL